MVEKKVGEEKEWVRNRKVHDYYHKIEREDGPKHPPTRAQDARPRETETQTDRAGESEGGYLENFSIHPTEYNSVTPRHPRPILRNTNPNATPTSFQREEGIDPEVIPSTFEENLSPGISADIRERPPDLVIAADTIVLTYPSPLASSVSYRLQPGTEQQLLEKPGTKEEYLRMLLDMNGDICAMLIFPVLQSPGYKISSIDERTLVYPADNEEKLIKSYVESGEGVDRAGGFAVQGLGGLLVRKIKDHNVVGFPAASFYKLLEPLEEEDEEFLEV
ncbi:hypothetical protein FA13DRAFT_1709522 [Coprinellus micaceus]|uniref:Maf/Ham1 n=1 Tax=Coprinellus micaceus TaxID=71717 RepID=A0A4Y7TC32_COPMI|nr:hypothetical protein FA13DRAFT_1709522 [Coprinellus micaceus]